MKLISIKLIFCLVSLSLILTQNISDLSYLQIYNTSEQSRLIQSLFTKFEKLDIIKNTINYDLTHFYSLQTNYIPFEIFNELYPIGTIKMFGKNEVPFYQNEFGISWELIKGDNTLLTTTNPSLAGTYSGENKIFNGFTEFHSLTIAELPSHVHVQGAGEEFPRNGYNQITQYRNHNVFDNNGRSVNTYPSGGNQGHNHGLRLSNLCLQVWRRKS